ncbi:ABC transporter substrate-binding protein [Chryseosolibacter indicus]|uniref:ABC transporter substrate-binding protein n=1 Tax=Chryseosolibacter indicus TaxID=2782351 RepID=A0ABS5VMR1_9BACT|nr:helical backbone metal receptor [Chryseosolibacter indicus]MBT1702125.1 ABC transporter substrate-binding protein [Chryseosolibacter indicus]
MALKSFPDQLGNETLLSQPPQRIISLVPSQTELLHDLGLNEEVIGITKFCIHPVGWLKTKTIIGGTKNFWFDVIGELNPNLIIGNKEENYIEGIQELSKKYPVWMSDIKNLSEALAMINSIGNLVGRSESADALIQQINSSFTSVKKMLSKRVLYLIWRNPWMAAASETFIHDMLLRLGLVNCLQSEQRYPVLSSEDITSLDPDIIMLSSEPFPFQEKHIGEIESLCPTAKVILIDGEMFSWYGSRLKLAPAYFNSLSLAE